MALGPNNIGVPKSSLLPGSQLAYQDTNYALSLKLYNIVKVVLQMSYTGKISTLATHDFIASNNFVSDVEKTFSFPFQITGVDANNFIGPNDETYVVPFQLTIEYTDKYDARQYVPISYYYNVNDSSTISYAFYLDNTGVVSAA